jgi:hypothetical protein
MTFRKYFSPFYDTARRMIGLSPAMVDHCISQRATATMTGNVVTITEPGGGVTTGTFRFYHRGRVGRWVNEFNQRAALPQ